MAYDPELENTLFGPPEQPSAEAVSEPRRLALVHILTPDFHDLDLADFEDIQPQQVRNSSPTNLRRDLIGSSTHGSSNGLGRSDIGYQDPSSGVWYKIAVTPEEYGLITRNAPALGRAAFNGAFAAGDKKARQESGDSAARARSDEDRRRAARAGLRPILQKQIDMSDHLEAEIEPRLRVVGRFMEMAKKRNVNLNRGSAEIVRERYEFLRNLVFDEMLDVIGNKKQWSEWQQARAKQIVQKRLYVAGSQSERVNNFRGMLGLANDYFGLKRDLILSRIAESNFIVSQNSDTMADIRRVDEAKRIKQAELDIGEAE